MRTHGRQPPTVGTVSIAYDVIGLGYAGVRGADPRLAAQIRQALGDARSVVNVGAGAGSYEPPELDLIAVEPSAAMIAQRPPGAARAVEASAEALPFADDTFDAAMALLTVQHWSDIECGLAEMCRVARRRVVLLTMDVELLAELWLIRDYLPEMRAAHDREFPPIDTVVNAFPNASSCVLPVPRDCSDGFMAAFWGRPEAYLDARIRRATSPWHQLPAEVVNRALAQLSQDLASGAWERRYGDLRNRDACDVGLRLIRAELAAAKRS
jgi:SAM-dependent methyltransferase